MFTCWLTQQWSLIRGDSGGTGFAASHRASCPSCKARAAAENRLIQRLRSASAAERAIPSPFLHGRILAALDREEPTEYAQRPAWVSLAALAPAVLLCAAVLLWMRPPPPAPIASAPASNAAIQQAILASAKYANGQLFLKLGENVENPLRREMASVVKDAKTVVNGLANRFLPENALAANTQF